MFPHIALIFIIIFASSPHPLSLLLAFLVNIVGKSILLVRKQSAEGNKGGRVETTATQLFRTLGDTHLFETVAATWFLKTFWPRNLLFRTCMHLIPMRPHHVSNSLSYNLIKSNRRVFESGQEVLFAIHQLGLIIF